MSVINVSANHRQLQVWRAKSMYYTETTDDEAAQQQLQFKSALQHL